MQIKGTERPPAGGTAVAAKAVIKSVTAKSERFFGFDELKIKGDESWRICYNGMNRKGFIKTEG